MDEPVATVPDPRLEDGKRLAAEAAADLVTSGMVVGLGTGSTARYAVEHLGRRLADGQISNIAGIPTSIATEGLARQARIPLSRLDEHLVVDLTIDGADEVSPTLDLIKGLGGALVREKIVAAASRLRVIAVDETKLVDRLGEHAPLPVALLPFAAASMLPRLAAHCARVILRRDTAGHAYVTDDGLWIAHLHFSVPIDDPGELEASLRALPGLCETGLFLSMTEQVFVGTSRGARRLVRPVDGIL